MRDVSNYSAVSFAKALVESRRLINHTPGKAASHCSQPDDQETEAARQKGCRSVSDWANSESESVSS